MDLPSNESLYCHLDNCSLLAHCSLHFKCLGLLINMKFAYNHWVLLPIRQNIVHSENAVLCTTPEGTSHIVIVDLYGYFDNCLADDGTEF